MEKQQLNEASCRIFIRLEKGVFGICSLFSALHTNSIESEMMVRMLNFFSFFSWHNRQSSGSHNRVYTLWVKNGRWVENDPNETGKGMRHS